MLAVQACSCFPLQYDVLSWKDRIQIKVKTGLSGLGQQTACDRRYNLYLCDKESNIVLFKRLHLCSVNTRRGIGWLFFSQNITVKRETNYCQYSSYSFVWLRIRW